MYHFITPLRKNISRVIGFLFLMIMSIYTAQAYARELKVFNWVDYMGKDTISHFEKDTGIKVTLDLTDSWETTEAKLLSGNSGYDVVYMGSTYFARQVAAGVWEKLDKNKLPNWKYIDPQILKKVDTFDPGNQYMQPWSWYGLAVAYNKPKIVQLFGADYKPDSWGFLFDLDNAKKLGECGVVWTDGYGDLFAPALIYYGFDPFSRNAKDYETVFEKVLPIRPYIKTFSNTYYDHLADGEMCASPSWTGDVAFASLNGKTKKGVDLITYIPKEGTYLDYEGVGILADSKNKSEAYEFLNYLLLPKEAAAFTNDIVYPNPVPESQPLINKKILDSHLVFYPTPEQMNKIHVWPATYDPKIERLQTRLWTKFKTKI